jgi:chromate transport protein ChrA
MRYFELLGFQHVVLALIPAAILVVLFYIAFSRAHFHGKNSEQRKTTTVHAYSTELEARNSPFPLILILIIVGFLLWAFFYTLANGLMGVKI